MSKLRTSIVLEEELKHWLDSRAVAYKTTMGRLLNRIIEWYKNCPKDNNGMPITEGFSSLQCGDDTHILVKDSITPDELMNAAKILKVLRGDD